MKKYLILIFLFISCSKLEYRYDSYINYSVYKKAYIYEIYNNLTAFYYSEEDMMNLFCNELSKKSAFNPIYSYFDEPQLADTLPQEYLELRLTAQRGEYKSKEINHDDGDISFKYEAKITVVCQAYNNNNQLIYQIERTGEYDDEYDYDSNDNFDEVKSMALEEALKEIAKFFTKSYVI